MNDEAVRELLKSASTIAVVGLSSNPMRPSFGVAMYMQEKGYKIIPVNPNESEVLGQRAVGNLQVIENQVDIVNVFRRSEFVPEIVEAAIRKNAKCIWLQEGITHPQATSRAEQVGLIVVSNRCILKEHRRLMG
jgi:uncharacterized protein